MSASLPRDGLSLFVSHPSEIECDAKDVVVYGRYDLITGSRLVDSEPVGNFTGDNQNRNDSIRH